MKSSIRFGVALSAVAVAGLLAGCSGPGAKMRVASGSGKKVDLGNIGLATRAQVALEAGQIGDAVSYAERAVTVNPKDAGFRALLGNIYLAAGRYTSAEGAYRDSLSLMPAQGSVVLKLALVQIAQGKQADALQLLDENRQSVDSADYGLAMALAGRPGEAVAALEAAARTPGADARVRQNLALSYAIAGDWTQARTVAAQDVPGDQLDRRIAEWMAFAQPKSSYDQVASLIGVAPVADAGMPVRLALNGDAPAMAAAQPVPEAVPAPVEMAAVPAPVEIAELPASTEAAAAASEPQPAIAAAAPVSEQGYSAPARSVEIKLAPARPSAEAMMRKAAASTKPTFGASRVVVQLGAYGSPQRVSAAWAMAARRHARLRAYSPMSARFDSSHGMVYRLSVRGFASDREAGRLCQSLRASGGSCFVRREAGDAPVSFASRS